ncbi:hypothetical protein CRENBAI_011040 [Crenichthys baileyi]|uniref:Uncharacterized protein n=1 Tax=Crenichthys baileyi TaxID=28760 RepID=A0AAV9RMH6_9TELE
MADMDSTDNHGVLPVESRKTPLTSLGSPASSGTGTVRRVRPPRSCVDFSSTSVYPGPSSKICCPVLGDESASGTPTTGAVSPLLNACPSVFGFPYESEERRSKVQLTQVAIGRFSAEQERATISSLRLAWTLTFY